jgi:hypothetical protein
MATLERLHPQFRHLLRLFLKNANTFLIHYSEADVLAKIGSRPILLDDDLSVNASVGRAEDGYAVYSVSVGAIAAITDISITLAATAQFFPQVEITGKAIETRTQYDRFHFFSYEQTLIHQGHALPLIPL